jgi:NADPH-dependent 2,4-dienoyl-CoA reductase/sulfur reductase-like enzyme
LPEIPCVAPSTVIFAHSESGKVYQKVARALTLAEIEKIENDFAEAAARAQQAGFDGIEIHGAHGYLAAAFLSPYLNHRTDKYGGSLEKRSLFALETVKKARQKVGQQFIIGYKMNGTDYVPGGFTAEEASQFARMLEEVGIDYITVSAGIEPRVDRFIQPAYIAPGSLVPLAGTVKAAVRIPVIAVGSLNIELAEKALRTGQADLVAMGRALIADPQLVNKLMAARVEDIRPCIRGNENCMDMLQTMGCEVNPACGKETRSIIHPASNKKNVLVIGGGIAGLEAARIAALKGYQVTLMEKNNQLGGHLIEAAVPDFKDGVKKLLHWAIRQVSKRDIKVRLNTEATPELVTQLKPDALIIAVGSDYTLACIKGSNKPNLVTASDLLLGRREAGKKIVVLGGGLVGCETALYIAECFLKPVVIVEMLDKILGGVNFTVKLSLEERLKNAGVDIHTSWQAREITGEYLVCHDGQGQRHELETETVVLATGLVERTVLVEMFKGLASETYIIGDCLKASNISHAIGSAWEAVLQI